MSIVPDPAEAEDTRPRLKIQCRHCGEIFPTAVSEDDQDEVEMVDYFVHQWARHPRGRS